MSEDSDSRVDTDEVRARSFWSGTITFGLVSIPVELFPANRSQGVSLRMVSADGVPLARRYYCPADERELDWDEIVRGYEVEDGRFVVVTDDELERLAPEKTRDIDLRRFVPAEDLDPIHFERAYYLTPGGNSTKAYRLLAETMEQSGRAGIATFVMRGKEYLIAILAEDGIMRAETLRFADEVRSADDVGLPEPVKPDAKTVKAIEKAIAAATKKTLDENELDDLSSARLLELVARKEKTGEGVVEAPAGEAEPAGGIIDRMEVLRRSLQGDAPERSGKSSAAKKTTTSNAAAKKSSAGKKSSANKSSTAERSSSGSKDSGTRKSSARKGSGARKSSARKGSGAKKSSARKGSGAKKSSGRKKAAAAKKASPSKSGAKRTKGAGGSTKNRRDRKSA